MDEDELDQETTQAYGSIQKSPNFDAKTGWYNGSIDELQGLLRGGNGPRPGSHASPVLRPELGGTVIPEFALNEYLGKFDDDRSPDQDKHHVFR
jgi:hypothetical protein